MILRLAAIVVSLAYPASVERAGRETLAAPLDVHLWVGSTLLMRAPLAPADSEEFRRAAALHEAAADAVSAAALARAAPLLGAGPVVGEERASELVLRTAREGGPEVRISKDPGAWGRVDERSRAWGRRLAEAARADRGAGGFRATAAALAELYEGAGLPGVDADGRAPERGDGDLQVQIWRDAASRPEAARRAQAFMLNRLRAASRPTSWEMTHAEPLPSGSSGGAIIGMPDRLMAVWKPYSWQEAAAYKLSERVDYRRVPAAVEGGFDGLAGSFRHYVRDAREKALTTLDAWVFAYLAGNPDIVNEENTLSSGDPEAGGLTISADHNIAFSESTGRRLRAERPYTREVVVLIDEIFARLKRGEKISAPFLAGLQAARPQDASGLGVQVSPAQEDAVARRLQDLQTIVGLGY